MRCKTCEILEVGCIGYILAADSEKLKEHVSKLEEHRKTHKLKVKEL